MKKYVLFLVLPVIAMLQSYMVIAQKDTPHDSAYYKTYPASLTARVYTSKKYAMIGFPSASGQTDLKYLTHTKYDVGIGATYNNLTLNVAYGVGYLDNNNSNVSNTKGLDFQLHLFPYKWAADAVFTSYKGAYATDSNNTDNRHDINLDFIGLSLYRVPNADKFSYRAAMVQNEWQKKSAGSLLYGANIYYGKLKSDSALVLTKDDNLSPQAGINNIHFISAGPGIGYAYTLVAAQHFFLTGSLVGNLDVTYTTEQKNGMDNSNTSVDPVAIYKAAAGYNGDSWSVAAIVGGNALLFKGDATNKPYYMSTGQFKIFVAKKIMLKKHRS
jgi:hypothetical protein